MGNVYVTGSFLGTVVFGATTLTGTTTNAFVAKLDAAGQWQWVVQPSSSTSNNGQQIAVDASGNVYVAGTYRDVVSFGATSLASRGDADVFVARLSASTGQWLGAARAGGPSGDSCNGLVVVGTDAYVAGVYGTAVAFDNLITLSSNPDNSSTFIAKLSGTQWQWATNVGNLSMSVHGLARSSATGKLYVSGRFLNTRSTAFGSTTLVPAAGRIIVSQVDAVTGQVLGAAQGGSGPNDNCGAIATDSQGRLVVLGNFGLNGYAGNFGSYSLPAAASASSTGDVYVACLDPAALTWQWATAVRCTDQIYPSNLVGGRNGEVCAVGGFEGTLAPVTMTSVGQSCFLARLDAAGQPLLVDRTTGTGNTVGISVAVDNAGEVYLGGAFARTVTLGTTTLSSANTANLSPNTVFIAKTGLLLGTRSSTVATTGLELYPNPARSSTTLFIPKGLLREPVSVTVCNALGGVVQRTTLPAGRADAELALDLANLPAGLYLVQLATAQGPLVKRLVVE